MQASRTRQGSSRDRGKVAIVEFTGVTGVGKTTLLHAVEELLAAKGIVARDAYDLILASYGLKLSRYPTLRSLMVDIVAFVPFLRFAATRKGMELVVLAMRVIVRDSGRLLVGFNLGRNFAKRIGVHMLLTKLSRQDARADLAFCDEGVLHVAHNVFVHTHIAPDPIEIEYFGTIVPTPDQVIWVRASREQSVEVILQRGHSRVGSSKSAARAFVEHGRLTFSILSSQDAIQDKLFAIENTVDSVANSSTSVQARAQGIADFLLSSQLTEQPVLDRVN